MIGNCAERRIRLDPARRLIAIEDRQLNIHQDQVRPMLGGRGNAPASPSSASIISKPALRQKVAQDLSIVLLVLDHENSLAHAFTRSARCCSTLTGRLMQNVAPFADLRLDPDASAMQLDDALERWTGRARCRPSSWSPSCPPAGTPRRSWPDPREKSPARCRTPRPCRRHSRPRP